MFLKLCIFNRSTGFPEFIIKNIHILKTSFLASIRSSR